MSAVVTCVMGTIFNLILVHYFREVNVYKLICKDTVEKNILKCGDDKIRLHEDISGKAIFFNDAVPI